jgi:HD-GYP domain-containing protein (c-di-GMP phosphodiesterase class II)
MSKILAVADVFEALTASRHYRDALSPKNAIKILEQDSGNKKEVYPWVTGLTTPL